MGTVTTMDAPDAGAALRHIDAPRHSASDWQAWLQARSLPLLERAAPRGPGAQRLVVVAPHPDDELLCCALLMQAHVRRGGSVHVVAVTDGEASHAGAPGWSPDRLRRVRQHERMQGLLGLQLPPPQMSFLRLPDGAVAAAEDDLRTALQGLLRPGDLAVTTWHQDGHPDHESCGRATRAAACAVGVQVLQAPVWMWHWAHPGDPAVPWAQLRCVPSPPADLARKRRALQAHASQCEPRGPGLPPVLDDAILARAAWPQEFYFVESVP